MTEATKRSVRLALILTLGAGGALSAQIRTEKLAPVATKTFLTPLFTGTFKALDAQLGVLTGMVNVFFSNVEVGPPQYFGQSVDLHVALPHAGVPASTVILSAYPAVPDGSYGVRFTFPWVNAQSDFQVDTPAGATTCTLQQETNYAVGEQYCDVSVNVTGGNFQVKLQLTRGQQASLQKITITRWR